MTQAIVLYGSNPNGAPTISASAADTASDCFRKWALSRLLGIPEGPPKAGTVIGTKTHKLSEVYGQVIAAGGTWRPHVDPLDPLPGELFESVRPHRAYIDAQTEREFWYAIDGVLLHGLIDVYAPRLGTGTPPLVQDIKTCKDWKWRKDAADLAGDRQANIYALFAMVETGADEADLEWLYTITTGAKRECRPSRARITRAEAEAFVRTSVVPLGRRMLAAAQAYQPGLTTGDDFEPIPTACQKFGGCPYYMSAHCNLDPAQAVASLISTKDQTMTLASQLASQLPPAAPAPAPAPMPGLPMAPAPAAPVPVPAAPVPVPAAPVPAPAAPVPAPPPPPAPAPVDPATVPGTMAYETAHGGGPLPADYVAPNGKPLPAEVTASGVVRVESGFRAVRALITEDGARAAHYLNLAADHAEARAKEALAVNPPEQEKAKSDDEVRAAEANAATEKKKRGPGRPKKEAPPAATGDQPTPTKGADGEPITLFVGCFPIGEECMQLEAVWSQAHAMITANDPAILDYAQLAYGEGAGRFRVCAMAVFEKAVADGHRLFSVADPSSRESAVALSGIRALAERVVQGSR